MALVVGVLLACGRRGSPHRLIATPSVMVAAWLAWFLA
jgi:hypothetical protein